VIAVDSSSFIAYMEGLKGKDTKTVDRMLEVKILCLPPPVVSELLSDPQIPEELQARIVALPRLKTYKGYWERAAESRRALLKIGLKARLADSLISQSCVDNDATLITRDSDFRHFAKHCGLKLFEL